MYDELIDLVDKNGVIIATKKRSEVFAQKLKNFRLVCALVRNTQGKFLYLVVPQPKKIILMN